MVSSLISTEQNVADSLLCGKDPNALALLTLTGEHTYSDLQKASQAIAEYLVHLGSRSGDRALIVSDNSFFSVAAYLGTLLAGLVSVPLPASTAHDELKHAIEVTEPKAAFVQVSASRSFSVLAPELSLVLDKPFPKPTRLQAATFAEILIHFEGRHLVPVEVQEDDLAALMFTSGSTGSPRAVMVSHGNLIANTEAIVEYLALTNRDRTMAVLPLHYCFGASLLHTHLRVGGSLVLDNRFLYPNTVLDHMAETRCTGFAGVPSHFQILLKTGLRDRSFPYLRYVQQAGGYLSPACISELQEALPNTKIFIMYGQTEATARLSYLPPESLPEKIGSIGRGLRGVRLRVVNENAEDVVPGENGEIVADGKSITQGYWRDPEQTAETFKGGKLHTGDIATVDQDGYIFIVDRAKDFLKCGGKRVGCRQIEQEILNAGNLLEVAVIGVPDPILGEAVKVFLVPRTPEPGLEERVQSFCELHLPKQLVPQKIVVLETLPKTGAGKVAKQLLRKLDVKLASAPT